MERFNGNVCAFQPALYEAPKVFESVRVNFSADVSFGMVNDLMNVILVQSPIAVAIIGREMRATFDVISDNGVKGWAFTIRDNQRSNFSLTLQDARDYGFVRHTLSKSRQAGFCFPVSVHEAGLTADESLIYFDVPLQFSRVRLMESQAKSLQHEPCGLLCDSQSAMNFQAADSVLAVNQHPESSHPLVEGDWRIFHNRSNLDGELLFAVIAEPDAASLNEGMFRSFAARASYFPVRPAQSNGIVERPLRIGEINNRLLQSLWLFHALILAYVSPVCQVYNYPLHPSVA